MTTGAAPFLPCCVQHHHHGDGHGPHCQHEHAHGHEHEDDHEHAHHHDHHDHHGHHRCASPRPGILLAAFGVALAHARQGYEAMEVAVREQFPDVPVAWAYTAHKVRRKLAARGQSQDSVAVALSRLHDDGVTHLVVQSLHTVPGVEYHWTRDQALAYRHPRKGFLEVAIGMPLLTSEDDLTRARQALGTYLPPERQPNEAVVLVGHGTYHHGQQRYLDYEACVRRGDPLVFLGALMGRPGEALGVSAVIDRLRAAGVSRCWLLPFMSVPGHHVQVDILGESPRSWKHRLQSAGMEVLVRPTGTLEHAPFRALWMDHLRQAFASLQQERTTCDHQHHGEQHAHF